MTPYLVLCPVPEEVGQGLQVLPPTPPRAPGGCPAGRGQEASGESTEHSPHGAMEAARVLFAAGCFRAETVQDTLAISPVIALTRL